MAGINFYLFIIVIKADSDCGNYSNNRRDGGNKKFIFIVIIVIKADSDCGNYSHNRRDGRNKFLYL